jgi:hypothetical protein
MGKHGNKHQVNSHKQKNRKNLSQDLYAFSVNRSVQATRYYKNTNVMIFKWNLPNLISFLDSMLNYESNL